MKHVYGEHKSKQDKNTRKPTKKPKPRPDKVSQNYKHRKNMERADELYKHT